MDAVIRAGGRSCIRGRLPIVGAVALSLAGASPGIARPKVSSAAPPEATPVFWPHASGEPHRIHLLSKSDGTTAFGGTGYGAIVDAAFSDPGCRPPTICRQGRRRTVIPQDPPSPCLAADLCGSGSAAADADTWIERIQQAITPDSAATRGAQAAPRGFDARRSNGSRPPAPARRLRVPPNGSRRSRIGSGPCATRLLTIRLPFETFYSSLSQEQHWRLNRTNRTSARSGARLGDARVGEMCSDPAAGIGRGADARNRTRGATDRAAARNPEELRLRSAGFAQLIMSSRPTYPLLGHMGRYGAALGSPRCHAVLRDEPWPRPCRAFTGRSTTGRGRLSTGAMRQLRRGPRTAVAHVAVKPCHGPE